MPSPPAQPNPALKTRDLLDHNHQKLYRIHKVTAANIDAAPAVLGITRFATICATHRVL